MTWLDSGGHQGGEGVHVDAGASTCHLLVWNCVVVVRNEAFTPKVWACELCIAARRARITGSARQAVPLMAVARRLWSRKTASSDAVLATTITPPSPACTRQ